MGRRQTIASLKRTVDALAERFPNAEVEYIYPKRYRGQNRTQLGSQTGFSVADFPHHPWPPIIRFSIEYASNRPLMSDEESANENQGESADG